MSSVRFGVYSVTGGESLFYRFQDGAYTQIPQDDPQSSGTVAAYITVQELEKLAPLRGFSPSTVRQCREEVRYFRSGVEIFDAYSFGTLKLTRDDSSAPEDCIAFYVCRNLFAVVDIRDSDGSTRACFESALRRFPAVAMTPGKLIFSFLDAMIEGDNKRLEDMEYDFSALEESVLRESADEDFTLLLLHHKQRLLLLHNYYEQLIDVGELLTEDENGLFGREDERYFRLFTGRAERLCRNVATLREQLSQLREAYQSTLDIRLNHTMKFFTALSAIFLPLSLLVGWYGMNFESMPEFGWKYGYLFVSAIALFVILFCIKIFKKHHWI